MTLDDVQAGEELQQDERGAIDLEVLAAAFSTFKEQGVRVEDADEVLAHIAGLLALCFLQRGVSNREEAIRWVGEVALDLYDQIKEGDVDRSSD